MQYIDLWRLKIPYGKDETHSAITKPFLSFSLKIICAYYYSSLCHLSLGTINIHIHIHIHIKIYINICVYIYINIYKYIYTYICVHIYKYL